MAARAESPSPAVPTSSKSSIDASRLARSSLKSASSSTTKILIGVPGVIGCSQFVLRLKPRATQSSQD